MRLSMAFFVPWATFSVLAYRAAPHAQRTTAQAIWLGGTAPQSIAGCSIATLTPASPSIHTDGFRRVTNCAAPQDRIAGFSDEQDHMPLTKPELPSDSDARQPLLCQGQNTRSMA